MKFNQIGYLPLLHRLMHTFILVNSDFWERKPIYISTRSFTFVSRGILRFTATLFSAPTDTSSPQSNRKHISYVELPTTVFSHRSDRTASDASKITVTGAKTGRTNRPPSNPCVNELRCILM